MNSGFTLYRSWRLLMSLVILALISRDLPASDGRGTIDLVTDPNAIFPLVQTPKPDYAKPFTDPTFGTRVIRIANNPNQPVQWLDSPLPAGVWGNDARHHYSKDQPWNSDSSLLVIQNKEDGTPSQLYLDGNTYQPRFGKCSNYDLGDDRWHPLYPNIRVNIKSGSNELQWFDVNSCTVVRSWTLPFAVTVGNGGAFGGEGNISADGRFVILTNNESKTMVLVDMDPKPPFAPYPNKRVGAPYSFADCDLPTNNPACLFDWVSISPSGKYAVVIYWNPEATGQHPRVFNVDANTLSFNPHPMPPDTLECVTICDPNKGYIMDITHADMALNPFDSNEDVLIGQRRDYCTIDMSNIGQVVMVRLKDGAVTSLLPRSSKDAGSWHISTRNINRPGWVYAGFKTETGKRFADESIAIKMDGSGSVERLVYRHSNSSIYRCEPHPVPSRDGKRVVFASSWTVDCGANCGSTSNPQDYVVDTRLISDLNRNNKVDFADFALFALQWLEVDCVVLEGCNGADIDLNGNVDFHDLHSFFEEWLAGN